MQFYYNKIKMLFKKIRYNSSLNFLKNIIMEGDLHSQLRAEYEKIGKTAKYGTAGFRDLATNIPYIVYKVGAFTTILNQTCPSKVLGVVISASHNKIEDNGLKITNFSGNMLQMEYEPLLEKFVDEADFTKACSDFKEYLTQTKKLNLINQPVNILIGGDTRPSTPKLLQLLSSGIKTQGGNPINFQVTTTPQLQYYVYLFNKVIQPSDSKATIDIQKMRPQFWQRFCAYFDTCAKYLNWNQVKQRTVDCANGVGGRLLPNFNQLLKSYLSVKIINNTKDQLLNNGCGADFVKVQGKFPSEYQPQVYNSFVSFDGDADRILLFSDKDGKLQLIDGDRQGTILTQYFKKISNQLKERTEAINQIENVKIVAPNLPTIGFVQTYYANYSSSEYLKTKYNMEPVFAATGVKHLHEKAEHYDIGIYYEANGHGTVIFNQEFLLKLQNLLKSKDQVCENPAIKQNKQSLQKLQAYFKFIQFYFNSCKLANPSVGDAITNFLLVEIAMDYLKMDYSSAMNLYTDLKSKTSKIQVGKKENCKVNDIEDKVVQPLGLQDQIQNILKELDGKKAFLRPSGTENVLRLHVEADTIEKVEAITQKVTELVKNTPQLF